MKLSWKEHFIKKKSDKDIYFITLFPGKSKCLTSKSELQKVFFGILVYSLVTDLQRLVT